MDSAQRLSRLVGALLVVVGFAYGIVGNLVADVLPEPGPVTLVVLVVGITLLAVGATEWNEWLNRQVDADAVRGIDPRNRPRLLEHVRAQAEEQLDQALHHAVMLELALEARSDVIEFPQDLLMRRVDEATAHPIHAKQSKLATFQDLDQAMLVLGEPGAGKTVWLNQLAIELEERAVADPDQPIPVVVNLASWATYPGPLDDWLVDELAATYSIDQGLGDRLVQADVLVPLLDGLDEVSEPDRAACVAAINAYQQARAEADPDTRLRPIVVCSRSAEAEILATNPNQPARLRLAGSITLQPPSRPVVANYLETVGAVEVLEMLPAGPDDDPELWALLCSPLTLSVIALTQTRAVEALHQPADQRLNALLDAYIEVLLTPRERGGRLRAEMAWWPIEKTRSWLAWLAASMSRRDLVEFRPPQLDPTWLAARWARWCGLWAPGVAIGLIFGMVVAGANGWRAGGVVGLLFGIGLRMAHLNWSARVLRWQMWAAWLAFALVVGLVFGLAAGLLMALVGVVFRVVDSGLFPHMSRARIYAEGIHRSGLHVLLLAGGFILVSHLTHRLNEWLPAEQLTQGLFGLAFVGRLIQEPYNLVATGLQAGLILGLLERWDFRWIHALWEAVENDPHPGPPPAMTSPLGLHQLAHRPGIIFGAARILGRLLVIVVSTVMMFIGFISVAEFLVLQAAFVWAGAIPRAYDRFLDAASDNLLLRKVGYGWRFPHRLLQDRLATYRPAARVAPAPDRAYRP